MSLAIYLCIYPSIYLSMSVCVCVYCANNSPVYLFMRRFICLAKRRKKEEIEFLHLPRVSADIYLILLKYCQYCNTVNKRVLKYYEYRSIYVYMSVESVAS